MIEPTFYTGCCLSPPVTQLGWYERQEITVSGKAYDRAAYLGAYFKGYYEPNYPLPVPFMVYEMDVEWYWLRRALRHVRSQLIIERLKPHGGV